MVLLFFTHIPFVVNHTINPSPPKMLQQHPFLFTTNHTDRTFFVWRPELGTTSTLHILVTAPLCCDRKSRAACAQSCALWQQAIIEIMLAISLTIACSGYICYGVILHAHLVRGESQSTQHHRRGCNNMNSPYEHFSNFAVPSRLFISLYRCLTFVFDVCWINPLMKQLCQFRWYLLLKHFLVCPNKLQTFTLSSLGEVLCWGRCWFNN